MLTFQFPTEVTTEGDLAIPRQLLRAIPPGSALQVILLVEPPLPLLEVVHLTDATLSAEAYTAALRQRPLPPRVMTVASGLLGEHLAQPIHAPSPDFDEAAWNAEWDRLEAALDADEGSDEQKRLRLIQQDLQP